MSSSLSSVLPSEMISFSSSPVGSCTTSDSIKSSSGSGSGKLSISSCCTSNGISNSRAACSLCRASSSFFFLNSAQKSTAPFISFAFDIHSHLLSSFTSVCKAESGFSAPMFTYLLKYLLFYYIGFVPITVFSPMFTST